MISDLEQKKLQKLARLNFSSDEAKAFSAKLDGVLDMINRIHEVQCENVEPLRSVCEMNQRMRQDKVEVQDIAEELFKNAPGNSASFAKEIKCFIVPKVIE